MSNVKSESMDVMEVAALEAIAALSTSNVLDVLTQEQKGALELKYAALPSEVQQVTAAKYPAITNPVMLYVIRQMVKEANGKLASSLRPGWITSIRLNIPALTSSNAASKSESERRLSAIADEMPDVKEAIKCLKSVKIQLDRTSQDAGIVAACKLFDVSASSLK